MTTMPISATAWTSRPMEAGARGRAPPSSSSSSRRAVVRRHGGRDGAGAMKMTSQLCPRRSARVRASSPEDDDNESASASSTISALDALLGSTDEPEPEPTPPPLAKDAKDEETRSKVITSDDAQASGWPSLSLPNLPWGASRDDDDGEDEEERAIVKRALANARADAAKTEPSMKSKGGLDYAVDAAYDPEFDPLGLGPRWEVPWGATTLIATLVAVEASFYLAGAIAPAIVYSGARNPDEIPFDDQAAFAKDLAALFEEPGAFADIVITAEVIQTVLALGVVTAVAASASPLPPGWFQISLTGDDVSISDGPKVIEGNSEASGMSSNVERSLKGSVDESPDFDAKRRATKIRAERKARSEDWGGEAARASLLVWGAVILITALSYATGLRGDESGTASNSTIEKAFDAGPGGALSLFLTTVVLAPLLEETVFRGFMLPTLTRWVDTKWALAITTVAFALVHEHNTGDTVQLLAVGAVAGVAYCRTRNLLASMAVHASFNLGVLVLFALWTHS